MVPRMMKRVTNHDALLLLLLLLLFVVTSSRLIAQSDDDGATHVRLRVVQCALVLLDHVHVTRR